MLDDIAAVIETPQTKLEQTSKSRGGPTDRRRPRPAAGEHGQARAGSGFTVVEMLAEFRALRATVIRLWTEQAPHVGRAEIDELTRFNEAIDQAIAESLQRYASEIDETRERFLAILGHDLRNPLGAITTAASFLAETANLNPEQAGIVTMIESATTRMTQLVADMLELALSRLGDNMPIRRSEVNLGDLIQRVVAEVRASQPKATIVVSVADGVTGRWDVARLAQALTNLIGNAAQHGDMHRPIHVDARGTPREVTIAVRNSGPTIPRERLGQLFDGPQPGQDQRRDRRHLGLGLFIVEKVIAAHGGSVEVHSAESETTFTVHLPRAVPAAIGAGEWN
jgi:signal transduction histidine kinase